jgi:hypothetical protein
MSTVTVPVTAGHIAGGDAGSSWGCAVALALEDAFPGTDDVSVGETMASLYRDDEEGAHFIHLDLPVEVRVFIGAYDRDEPVEPFTFTVAYEEVPA